MIVSVSVGRAAEFLSVSEQRVRVLLGQGRLSGRKDRRNVWCVRWPIVLRLGRRGPSLRRLTAQ